MSPLGQKRFDGSSIPMQIRLRRKKVCKCSTTRRLDLASADLAVGGKSVVAAVGALAVVDDHGAGAFVVLVVRMAVQERGLLVSFL